ncbi:MAG TPA: hypothetical protein PKA64_15405 [Myxococcota bacterium]|nr:hypothetical protein [Myxococcota bacterium]
MRKRYEDRVRFVEVSILPNRAGTLAAAKRYGLEGTLAMTTGNLLELLGVNGVPTTAFVSADGRIIGVAEGMIGEKALDDAVKSLLVGGR